MASKPKTNGAGSVIADIEKRLRRIKSRDFVRPGAQPHVQDVIVCPADNYMKRLFTLRAQVGGEVEQLAREGQALIEVFKIDGKDGLMVSRFASKIAGSPMLGSIYAEKAVALEQNSQQFGELHGFFKLVEQLCEVELSKRAPRNYEGGYVTIDSNWNIVRTQVHPLGKKRENRKVVGVLYEA